MLYRNILVAVDGSDESRAALEHAIALAQDQHSRVTLVTVVPPAAAGSARNAEVIALQQEAYEKTSPARPSQSRRTSASCASSSRAGRLAR